MTAKAGKITLNWELSCVVREQKSRCPLWEANEHLPSSVTLSCEKEKKNGHKEVPYAQRHSMCTDDSK